MTSLLPRYTHIYRSLRTDYSSQIKKTGTRKMRPPFSVFILLTLVLTLCFSASAGSHNLIDESCQKFAQNDRNIDYDFCVTSLQAVPGSHCSNLRGLGLISIKLVQNNITNTRSYIKKLMKNKKFDQSTRDCLSDCLELYSDAIPEVKNATTDYNLKHYDDANIKISSVMDAASTCEDGFQEKKAEVFPLTDRNNDTFQLSAIALSIMKLLSKLFR